MYDSVKLKTYQLRFRVKAAQYFKTGKQTVLKTGINAGWYESPSYFRNELFQIGGYKLLRGLMKKVFLQTGLLVTTLNTVTWLALILTFLFLLILAGVITVLLSNQIVI